ncbi:MAG: alpha/beta fold hydrolase [Actinomycetia bacterium]|nr:alpha/beta fold hydrolase [Actinomycetes bacterium]MCH9766769.1 alpha/beta fold hydrolase [Actinomycetes bacterium]
MTVRLAELLAIGVLALLVGAALVYLLGSFFLMVKHVSPRPGQRHLAAMLHEFYYVLITQPLIPLYYVIGRRLGPGEGIPVIFIHGYFQNRADFVWLAKQFRKTSKGPLYGFNYPWFDSVDRNVPRLARFVEQTCAETGSDKVTLISHSLGGLVSLEFAHSPGGHRVAHCITIGTPHAGVKWRGPILGKVARELRAGGEFTDERRERNVVAPTLSVYSTHDNIVHPPSTCELAARGGSDVAIDGVGHLSLLYSPEVARVLIDFIERPD